MIFRLARPIVSALRTDVRPFSQSLAKSRYWPENTVKSIPRPAPLAAAQNNNALSNFLLDTQKVTTPSFDSGVWETRSKTLMDTLRPPQGIHAGRSIFVSKGLSYAWKTLQRRLKGESFVYELRLGARHEKKGAKRRRLASERWRRRFAHEVRKKVHLVNEIRARGA